MKVYILTAEAFPNGMAATQRIRCYAKALLYVGVDCEVICFHRSEVFGKKIVNSEIHGISDGIPFRYIGSKTTRSHYAIVRKFWDYVDMIHTLRYIKNVTHKGDAILWFCGTYLYFSLIVLKIAHWKKVKFVRELCELPYGTGKETKNTIKRRSATLRKQFPLLDGVVAISETLKDLAIKYCNAKCNIVKIPIMVDFEEYSIADLSQSSKIPYIFHSGTLYEQKDGILGVFEAFGKACQQLPFPIQFISTGNKEKSPHKAEIDHLIEKYNLRDNLIFTGYLSDEDLKNKLSKASLVIINKYRTQQNNFCFSTKLGEYLAAAKPVIITRVGEAMNYVEDGKTAIVVEPEDNDALTAAIVTAFSYLSKMREIGQNAKIMCKEQFDYKSLANVLRSVFDNH